MKEAPGLVVAGRFGWRTRGMFSALRAPQVRGRVCFPGFVAEAALPALYRAASVFVCVSLCEGFGLPVLEAMAGGVPVVASNVSSLPEIVGDAGLLVPPGDPGAIARALRATLEDPASAGDRAARARQRAKQFSWRSTAEKTLEAYCRVAARRANPVA
jgi:glycosyltransferase involved in cell wall biosynthesis